MSKIEELINELCPDGVEYKNLSQVLTIKNGKDYKGFDKGDVPVYGTGGIMTYIDQAVFEKPSVLIPRKGSLDKLYYVDVPFWTVDTIFYTDIRTEVIEPKYVFYYLQAQHLEKLNTAGGVPSLTQAVLNTIKIPLPPLPVQQEIVRILDNFTELTAELTARKQQYEYYKKKLLTFNESVPRIPLGDICLVQSGGTPSKAKHEYWDNGTIKWLGSTVCQNQKTVTEVTNYISEIGLKNSSAKLMKKETTLIALVGATIGKIAFLPFEATINQNIAGVYPVDVSKLSPSYVFHACGMLYDNFIGLSQGKLAMANLSFVRGLKIPVPSLEEQERIASILDHFDALVNDISSGIPAEIEARRKQYEYYRDKLLSFKEVSA